MRDPAERRELLGANGRRRRGGIITCWSQPSTAAACAEVGDLGQPRPQLLERPDPQLRTVAHRWPRTGDIALQMLWNEGPNCEILGRAEPMLSRRRIQTPSGADLRSVGSAGSGIVPPRLRSQLLSGCRRLRRSGGPE